MRVLHIYSGNLFGGVETLLLTLVRRQGSCPGMESRVAVCFPGRLAEALEASGNPPARLGGVRARYPWTVRSARRRLGGLLKAEGIDIAVCHGPWAQAVFGPAVRSAGLPLAFWLHHAPQGRHWVERWARLTPPDLAVCNSRFTAAALPALHPGVRSEVLYAPVSVSPAVPRNGTGVPVILQASRLEPWKGQAVHLEALALLKDLPWTARFAGGPQSPAEKAFLG